MDSADEPLSEIQSDLQATSDNISADTRRLLESRTRRSASNRAILGSTSWATTRNA